MAIENRFPFFEWRQGPRENGVTLRLHGEGMPLVIVPGMEGSGESNLHLVSPLYQALHESRSYQLILLDYTAESHHTLAALVETSFKLLNDFLAGRRAILWGQSFGNILALMAAARGLEISLGVLVSPFSRLPGYAGFGAALLSITPGFLYRATAASFGRFLFGPPGDRPQHEFFDSLAIMPTADIVRRARWCVGRDFSGLYANFNVPFKVWLGRRDRLINFADQGAFFSRLAEVNEQCQFSIIDDCGHVAISTAAATQLEEEVGTWLDGAAVHLGDGQEVDAA